MNGNCEACGLYATRKNTVWFRGSDHPDVLLIGEAPGEEEDIQGLPFVGKSGKLLDRMLEQSGITNFTVVNVVKCRPPRNRKPNQLEINMCAPFLKEQLSDLHPKLIVCLGATALNWFFPDTGVTRAVIETSERFKYYNSIYGKVMVVFHPSYVLRGSMKESDYLELFQVIKCVLEEI